MCHYQSVNEQLENKTVRIQTILSEKESLVKENYSLKDEKQNQKIK